VVVVGRIVDADADADARVDAEADVGESDAASVGDKREEVVEVGVGAAVGALVCGENDNDKMVVVEIDALVAVGTGIVSKVAHLSGCTCEQIS
jgi:hypothetical protein